MAAAKKTAVTATPEETPVEIDSTPVVNNAVVNNVPPAVVPMPVEMGTRQTSPLSEALAKQLQEPFPPEMLRFNKAKGLTYIPISEVIARLNRVLGFENWEYEVVRAWREPDHPDWCLAHVSLRVHIGGKTIERAGYGGQQVKFKKNGEVVDLGDEFKGAVSDALKKAAQSLGVGLELARTEEAKRWEEDMASEVVSSPETEAAYEKLIALTKQMGTEEKSALRTWWKATYGEDVKVGLEAGLERLQEACKLAEEIVADLAKAPIDPVDALMEAFPGSQVA